MKTSVTARHFDLTEITRNYVAEAMEGLGKFFDRINEIQVVLDQQKERWSAEITVGVPGRTLHAADTQDQLHPAIDQAIEKVLRQLEKYKAKVTRERDLREARRHVTDVEAGKPNVS